MDIGKEYLDAVKDGDLKKVKLMFDREEHKETNPAMVMFWVAKRNQIDLLEFLIKQDYYQGVNYNIMVFDAVGSNSIDVIKYLLKNKEIDLLYDGCAATRNASEEDRVEILELLTKELLKDGKMNFRFICNNIKEKHIPIIKKCVLGFSERERASKDSDICL